jgi:DNA repair exonuclease SbcCD ATPase subunit
MSQEIQQSLFKELAAGLPDQHRAEFFRTLHEAGISQNDVELARLLRALQLYKAYYESIPAAVHKAAAEIERIKKEVEGFSRDAHQSSDASAQLAGQVIQETERVRKDLAQIHDQIEKTMVQSSESIGFRMAELLNAGIEKAVLLPFQSRLAELAGSNKAFGDAIAQSNKAAATLRENVKVIRRAHIGTYVLCGLVIISSLLSVAWFFLHQWYADQIRQEHAALVGYMEKNRTVLLDLAKSHRTLEMIQDPEHPDRNLLILKDASGWQSIRKYGVIEFSK